MIIINITVIIIIISIGIFIINITTTATSIIGISISISISAITTMILNLIYIAQFHTNGILTVLHIVIKLHTNASYVCYVCCKAGG